MRHLSARTAAPNGRVEGGLGNFAQLRADFPGADIVGRRTVFNIGGNKYRLIARVSYHNRKAYPGHHDAFGIQQGSMEIR